MQTLNYMPRLSQRGAIHLIVPIILLLGIIGGVYLITAGPLKLFPKASVSGPIGGVTYVDAKIGCGNPEGLTPDQICQQRGFPGSTSTPQYGSTVAQGFWWRQCAGASVSGCVGLDCNISQTDCVGESQQPYPANYLKVGGSAMVYRAEELGGSCSSGNPGWTMRVACSLATKPSPPPPTEATGQVKCEEDISCGVGKRCEQPGCSRPAIYCPPDTDQTPCQPRDCPKVCVDDPNAKECLQDQQCPGGYYCDRGITTQEVRVGNPTGICRPKPEPARSPSSPPSEPGPITPTPLPTSAPSQSPTPSLTPSPPPSSGNPLSSDFVQLSFGGGGRAGLASGKVTVKIIDRNEQTGYGRFEISGKLMALYPNETYQLYLCESPWSNNCNTDNLGAFVTTNSLGTAIINGMVLSAPLQQSDRIKSLRVINQYAAGPVDPRWCYTTGSPCLRGEYNISWQDSTRPRVAANRSDIVLNPASDTSTPRGQGRGIVELLSYDRQTDNAELRFSGSFTGLLPRHVYGLWVCWPDRTSCSGNSYPRIVADEGGVASLEDLIIAVYNRPNNRVSWLKLTESGCVPGMESEPGCSSGGRSSLESPFSLPEQWLFPSPSPSPTPVACTFNDLRAAFFTKRGDPKYNQACDLNNDGAISIFDFGLLRRSSR